jgi:TonB-dependent starch-binding outer membrane protein SusC
MKRFALLLQWFKILTCTSFFNTLRQQKFQAKAWKLSSMNRKYFAFSSLISMLLLSPVVLSAQNTYKVQGLVIDSATHETLVGATIVVKGSQKGIVTDANGNYSLSLAPVDYTFIYTYTGYEKKEVSISLKDNLFINVALKQEITSIKEVKISGQRKFFGNMEYGREIPSINSKTIEKLNTNNASDILHASVAGVWATKTSGLPGDHEKIRIRGQNSFFASAEPLYVVDGVPVPIVNMSSLGIADLNIHDIENITILRDASATALYGFQGGNGVVLIDTKKGGENEISFSVKEGFQWFDNFYDLMNTRDFLASLQFAKNINSGLVNFYPKITDNPSDDNWQKEIFRTGSSQEYQLSASGTIKKIKYYLSGNYTDQQGILENTSYRRYTFSSRLSRIIGKKIVIEGGYRGSLQENKNNQDIYNGNPYLFAGITKSPCLRNTPDSLSYAVDVYGSKTLRNRIYCDYPELNSPELPHNLINHSLRINSHIINGSARLQLSDHLSLNAMESLMFRYSNYFYGASPNIVKSNENVILYNHQYNIYYFNTFDKHKIDLVAAYRFYSDNLWWKVDTMRISYGSQSHLRNSMAAYGPKGSVIRSIGSYVANASYNYNETYFISAVANVSNIIEGLHTNYYYVFPSLACSWDVAHEWPLKKMSWLNNLSFYVNWGKSGNYPLNGLSNDLYRDKQYAFSSTTGTFPTVMQLANHFLKHESTDELDYGIKSSFFDKRFSINVVTYTKSINNLILQRQIPFYYGGGMLFLNIGEISVNGQELNMEADLVKTVNFSWHLKFSFSSSHQIVKKVLDDRPMVFSSPTGDILGPEYIIKEGQSFGDIYGYKVLGKWTDADYQTKDVRYYNYAGTKFLNADTLNKGLTANDMILLGNSIPQYTWNFSTTFQYSNFSLDMTWYAVQGVKKFNATYGATMMTGTNRKIINYLRDSIYVIRFPYYYQSSAFIDDASFIRLKNITFIWEPSKKVYDRLKFKFSVSFENMITFTKYKGYDPEATTFTDNNFSDNAYDRGAVPNPKAFYASIGVTF